MPLYEYECSKCGQRTERIEKFTGPNLKKCPKCGGRVERMASAPAIQFKGSGWYVTDYAKSGSTEKRQAEGSNESKPAEKSEGKSEGKSDAKPAEKSGAKDKKKAATKEK